MAEYTKGKRQYEKLNNGKWIVSTGGGLHVPRTTIGIFSIKEDAILDTASPDMYEALKEITELAPRDKLRLPYAIAVVEIADKALAKVEGKQ